MEQTNNTERKIVYWKLNNNNWSVESFLESHPEYKSPDSNMGYAYWPVIFTLADELGFDEDIMQCLFEKKPTFRIVDLVFALYLVRLYGTQAWEEFFRYKKTINQGEVHGFIKVHEGMIRDLDTKTVECGGQSTDLNADVQDFKDCLQILRQLLDQHEVARKDYEEAIVRLCQISEKREDIAEDMEAQSAVDFFDVAKNHRCEDPAMIKHVMRLDRENAVLKTQLEAEKREAIVKYDAAMELKRLENGHLKDQMQQLRYQNQMLQQMNVQKQMEQIPSGKGFLKRKQVKVMENDSLDERQKLAVKIISGMEYPHFLKEFIQNAYKTGMNLETMKMFDKPELDHINFVMMKSVIENESK